MTSTTKNTFDAKRHNIASFDVDAQKTFTPICPDELPVPEGDQIVDELNANARFARIRVGSRDVHAGNALWIAKSSEEVLAPVVGENIDVKWPEHAMLGTKGCELLDGLPHPITGYDFMVSKGIDPDCHPYGACYHDLGDTKTTGIIEFLKANKITTVVVGGLALDYCVSTTVKQLCKAGFIVIVNLAATRGIAKETCDKAIEEMKAMGATVAENADCIEWLLT